MKCNGVSFKTYVHNMDLERMNRTAGNLCSYPETPNWNSNPSALVRGRSSEEKQEISTLRHWINPSDQVGEFLEFPQLTLLHHLLDRYDLVSSGYHCSQDINHHNYFFVYIYINK